MKNILITGGAGFIGSHTADLLLKAGMQVTVFDNLSTGKLANLNVDHPELKFIHGDILDYPALLSQIKQCDAVLHLAALSSVPKSIEDPLRSLQINTQGFVHILQAIREKQQPTRLVYASSAAIYGSTSPLPCSDAATAELPQLVLSPYALDKANNERYANLYAHLFNLPSLALRYFNVYGPRQDPESPYSGVIAKFTECYRNKKPITIWGDGTQSRDFIHVTDVARANLLALQASYAGAVNIATGVAETLKNLVSYIEKAGDQAIDVNFTAAHPGDIPASYATIDKAETQLAFRYTIDLVDGIRQLMTKI